MSFVASCSFVNEKRCVRFIIGDGPIYHLFEFVDPVSVAGMLTANGAEIVPNSTMALVDQFGNHANMVVIDRDYYIQYKDRMYSSDRYAHTAIRYIVAGYR